MQHLEKPKLKHNKKRNTAFLFEALVKELTKAAVYGDKNKQKIVTSLIKEHFRKNSVLDRELTLYKQVYETKQFPKQHAEKLLNQVKEDHDTLSESDIFNEQSKLIAKMNKMLGSQIYTNHVSNYKTLASLSQIFSKGLEPKKRILLEQEVIEFITSEPVKQTEIPNSLTSSNSKSVLDRFVDRFNKTYSSALLEEQKELLSRYIRHNEDDIDLKIYLNEEVARLKNIIKNASENEILKENVEIGNKVKKMYETVLSTKIETINEELIKKIMLIQEFVSEVQK